MISVHRLLCVTIVLFLCRLCVIVQTINLCTQSYYPTITIFCFQAFERFLTSVFQIVNYMAFLLVWPCNLCDFLTFIMLFRLYKPIWFFVFFIWFMLFLVLVYRYFFPLLSYTNKEIWLFHAQKNAFPCGNALWLSSGSDYSSLGSISGWSGAMFWEFRGPTR